MRLYLLILFCLLGIASHAEVYVSYDENGNPVYSDEQPNDRESEQIEVPETNTQPSIEIRHRPSSRNSNNRERAANLSIQLSSPADGTQFGPKEEYLSISAELGDGLPAGYLVRFMMNGQPLQEASRNTFVSVHLTIKLRGTKTLHAEIIDAETGDIVASSEARTVYVIRPGGSR